uniref:Uncharacterized protein n=6 Tax=Enterobacterales TaxID=91347 RepID=Q8KK18_PROVU|nr:MULTISPECIES: hypothetical protein [Enterobacterales]WAT94367.1 hypothetical protein OS905_00355 [Escherichia sp. J-18004577]BAB93723.1 hypothetical protein [Proteus vulgaris]
MPTLAFNVTMDLNKMKKLHYLIAAITFVSAFGSYANSYENSYVMEREHLREAIDTIKKEFQGAGLKKDERCVAVLQTKKEENSIAVEYTAGDEQCIKAVLKSINNAKFPKFSESEQFTLYFKSGL